MSTQTPHITSPSRLPASASPTGDGIVVGSGPVQVDAFIDFLCPFCRQFEEKSGPILDELVADEAISLVYHPMGFLDNLSTTRYSSRASAASGCASDGGRFMEYLYALFANQPPRAGPACPMTNWSSSAARWDWRTARSPRASGRASTWTGAPT
ncbi:thioredoxin domain-containing protein [Streptomyces sp. NPDC046931]|uniref:DsbA family protein n=1 Tax=Streptomyces sp. NPDC046931 TaxID=3154806 RepID=UPI0033FE68FC